MVVRLFPDREDERPPIPVEGGGGTGARLGSAGFPRALGVEVDVRRWDNDEDDESGPESGFVGFFRYANTQMTLALPIQKGIYPC